MDDKIQLIELIRRIEDKHVIKLLYAIALKMAGEG